MSLGERGPARVWVRALLTLYPRDFRAARGAEIHEMVAAEVAAAADRSMAGRAWTRLRLGWDLVVGAVRMRRRGAPRRHGSNREGWTMEWTNDVRVAARALARSPGFAAVVVLTLGLGMGLSTAVFSVVDGVLLRPLGYDAPGRLVYVQVGRTQENSPDALVGGGDWQAFRAGMPGLDHLEAVATIRQTLSGAGLPRQVQVGWVSPGFLDMLGVEPVLGRTFRPDDPPGTAVLSHRLWVDHLGADPDVVGRTVRLDGHLYTLVGVAPAGFRLDLPSRGGRTPDIDIWNPDAYWQNGDVWANAGPEFGMLRMVGSVADGVGLDRVQAQADATLTALAGADAEYAELGYSLTVHDLKARLVEGVRPLLLMLMGAVLLVLLIACANVANLLLARAHGRRADVAVRAALGASRRRIARYLLAESLVLAVAGGMFGMAVALGFLEAMPWLVPADLPRLQTVGLSPPVVLFATGLALGTTLVVGVVPALGAVRTRPGALLRSARTATGGQRLVRDGLVVSQMALSLVLLAGTGLLVASLAHLARVDPGFEADGVFTFAVSVPGTDYGWPEEAGRYYRAVQDRVAQIPGVRGAGVVWPMPFSGRWDGDVAAGPGEGTPVGVVPYYLATEEYFATAGVPLREGRLFRPSDDAQVAVVSESVARRAFPDGSALGRTIQANPWGRGPTEYTVVGVVGDIRQLDLREPTAGGVYFDARSWSWVDWEVHVLVRTDVAAGALVPAIRAAVAEIDADVPVARPRPLSELVDTQSATARFVLALLGVFAGVAGVVALVGLYGVVSYSVGLRRRELGIRMALGSAREGIARLVVGRGLAVAGVGVAVGVGGALLLGRFLEAWLFEVRPGDPATLAAAALFMTAAAGVASWIPARRAARTDPVEVLRGE